MPKSTVSLRVFGDDLEPAEVSTLLGCAPDSSYRKGDLVLRGRPEHKRRCGMWSLKAREAEPEAYEFQIQQMLTRVSQDKSIWKSVHERYQVDLFCGFFMDTRNQGFVLSVATIELLVARGLQPGFDIYAPTPEEVAEYYAKQGDA